MTVLAPMTLAAAGYLGLSGRRGVLWLVLLAVASGSIVSTLLKWAFERPRPAGGSDLVQVFTSSFPSGHSMLSAVVYLVLGTLLARAEPRRAIKILLHHRGRAAHHARGPEPDLPRRALPLRRPRRLDRRPGLGPGLVVHRPRVRSESGPRLAPGVKWSPSTVRRSNAQTAGINPAAR